MHVAQKAVEAVEVFSQELAVGCAFQIKAEGIEQPHAFAGVDRRLGIVVFHKGRQAFAYLAVAAAGHVAAYAQHVDEKKCLVSVVAFGILLDFVPDSVQHAVVGHILVGTLSGGFKNRGGVVCLSCELPHAVDIFAAGSAESYVEKIPGDCQGVGTAGSLGEQSQLFGFGSLPVESHAGTCVESRP